MITPGASPPLHTLHSCIACTPCTVVLCCLHTLHSCTPCTVVLLTSLSKPFEVILAWGVGKVEFGFETRFCYVAHVGLNFSIVLPQFPENLIAMLSLQGCCCLVGGTGQF